MVEKQGTVTRMKWSINIRGQRWGSTVWRRGVPIITDTEELKEYLECLFQVHHTPNHLILMTPLGREELCPCCHWTDSFIHPWDLSRAFESCFIFHCWFVSSLLHCPFCVRDTPWIDRVLLKATFIHRVLFHGLWQWQKVEVGIYQELTCSVAGEFVHTAV